MNDDFTPLTNSNHWLGDDPAAALREEIESILRKQVANATLEWIRLVGEPYFLTGGRKIPEEPIKIIVTRAGLAVAFELQVRDDDHVEQLTGVFSWVAIRLDGERRDRIHFDLGADLAWASESLKARLYEMDAAV